MNSPSFIKTLFAPSILAVAILGTSTSSLAQVVDQIIAVVDNSAILKSDLDQATQVVRQQLMQQGEKNIDPQELRKDVLDQLILRQAQLEQVKRYGLTSDENALNKAVLTIAKKEGYDSLEAFQQHLDSTGKGRYAALRSQVADDLKVSNLRQQQVMSRIKISDRDVDNFLKSPQGQAALGIQVHTLHVRIAATEPNISNSDLQKVARDVRAALAQSNDIDAIAQQFQQTGISVQGTDSGLRALSEMPADLAARISGLSTGKTTEIIQAKDGLHILKVLERQSTEKKALVQQYLTRHILIQPSEVMSLEDAKQRIDQIYTRLKQGADFAELAATYSTDPGSARNGGSLDWVVPGVMVPEFDKKMQESTIGEISQPFQTQYGWHILQVQDSRQVDMTEEYQRRIARQVLGERQFNAEVDSWLREVRANAYVDIKDPSLKDADL